MLISSVTSKLTKSGWVVSTNGSNYLANKHGLPYVITFLRNGGTEDAVCLRVRRLNDHDDSQSDYCAGSFFDSIKQAIHYAESWNAANDVKAVS